LPILQEDLKNIKFYFNKFLTDFYKLHNKLVSKIDKAFIDALMSYTWSCNIRKLKNVVEHIFILYAGNKVIINLLSNNVLNKLNKKSTLKIMLKIKKL